MNIGPSIFDAQFITEFAQPQGAIALNEEAMVAACGNSARHQRQLLVTEVEF